MFITEFIFLFSLKQGSFDGKCMLYGSVRLNTSSIGVLTSSSPSLCYFVSAISVCVAVFCFSLTLYWIYMACVDGEVKRYVQESSKSCASEFALGMRTEVI